jgi:hypothetical protein
MTNPERKKPEWDVEENEGFVLVKSNVDNLDYKVLINKPGNKQDVANVLARIRTDLNTLLVFLCQHPEKWINKSIALGIFLTFNIHVPCMSEHVQYIVNYKGDFKVLNDLLNSSCSRLFVIQELPPNSIGLVGLNKPIRPFLKVDAEEYGYYEIPTTRRMFLTIRDNNGNIIDYKKTLLLAIHELTHTTRNDIYWKSNNHDNVYNYYHNLMKGFARECGILH